MKKSNIDSGLNLRSEFGYLIPIFNREISPYGIAADDSICLQPYSTHYEVMLNSKSIPVVGNKRLILNLRKAGYEISKHSKVVWDSETAHHKMYFQVIKIIRFEYER